MHFRPIREYCFTAVFITLFKIHKLKNKTFINLFQKHLFYCLFVLGFYVYHITEPEKMEKPVPVDFFKYHKSCAVSGPFSNRRQVSVRLKLDPGTYLIVPCTFEADQVGEFLLRVYAEQPVNLECIQQ